MRTTRRKAVGLVLALLIGLGYFSPLNQTLRTLPTHLALTRGQTHTVQLGAPLTLSRRSGTLAVLSSGDETLRTVSLAAETAGTSELTLSLLGILPVRRVEVEVGGDKRLIPGGMAVGVALRTDGVLVVGTGGVSGGESPAVRSGIRAGDVLRTVNGVHITSSQQLTGLIESAGASPLLVEYSRDGAVLTTSLTPVWDETTGTPRIGAWVRDSTAGVGTLSFYDPDTAGYAALGHAITDGDTGQVLTVSQGQILAADIVGVQRGKKGAPGELKGSFLSSPTVLGTLEHNGVLGIYGTLDAPAANPLYPDGLPVGLRSGVHTGPAQILSTVDGTGPQAFDVEITRVNPQSAPAQKSMVVHVTDQRLLDATGGIVQGMSGSPIIQDGRIIGAVTHVCVTLMMPMGSTVPAPQLATAFHQKNRRAVRRVGPVSSEALFPPVPASICFFLFRRVRVII